MSDQRWSNVVLEREQLALRWHCVGICRGCWAKDVRPTSNQPLVIRSAWWVKYYQDNVSWQHLNKNTAKHIPTLAQRMIAVWEIVGKFARLKYVTKIRMWLNLGKKIHHKGDSRPLHHPPPPHLRFITGWQTLIGGLFILWLHFLS